MESNHHHPKAKKSVSELFYQIFKYTIYLMILYSVVVFFNEDHAAANHLFKDGITLSTVFQAYPQFIDTLSWYILLILFELETYAIESEDTYKKVRWGMYAVYAICYTLITLAFLGYVEQMIMVYSFEPSSLSDICSAAGKQVQSIALELNDYIPITADNCASVQAPVYINTENGMITDTSTLSMMKRMIATDVLNAGAWLLIVVVLQIDVLMQEYGKLTPKFYRTNLIVKLILYAILFICAGYWWMFGTYMDFQDASLWIIAFFFIELNLFKWHAEEKSEQASERGTP